MSFWPKLSTADIPLHLKSNRGLHEKLNGLNITFDYVEAPEVSHSPELQLQNIMGNVEHRVN